MNAKDDKDEIAKQRSRGGHFEVGDGHDGAIKEMLNIDGRLIVIKERAIYEVIFAETIDPERLHANTPLQTQRKIVALGTESQLASKTLLTALKLMKSDYIKPEINIKRALEVVQEMLVELNQLTIEQGNYLDAEKSEIENYEYGKVNNLDYRLPSIPDILTRCKTFFQKADHVIQAISELNSLFFPGEKLFDKAKIDTFQNLLINQYGESDQFVVFIKEVGGFIILLRNLRDGLDHRNNDTIVTDFERQLNNDVLTPTVTMNRKKVKLERHSLADLMQATTKNLLYICETSIAFLCEKQVRIDKNFRYTLRQIPVDQRMNKYIKYAFWLPIGTDGFYMQ